MCWKYDSYFTGIICALWGLCRKKYGFSFFFLLQNPFSRNKQSKNWKKGNRNHQLLCHPVTKFNCWGWWMGGRTGTNVHINHWKQRQTNTMEQLVLQTKYPLICLYVREGFPLTLYVLDRLHMAELLQLGRLWCPHGELVSYSTVTVCSVSLHWVCLW